MSHVCLTDWTLLAGGWISEERSEISSGKIQFDRDRFVFDQRPDAAKEVEAFFESGPDRRTVSFTWHHGDSASRGRWRNAFGCGQAGLPKFQGEWGGGGKSEAPFKKIPPAKFVRFHK
jgi:hypothetical protein